MYIRLCMSFYTRPPECQLLAWFPLKHYQLTLHHAPLDLYTYLISMVTVHYMVVTSIFNTGCSLKMTTLYGFGTDLGMIFGTPY